MRKRIFWSFILISFSSLIIFGMLSLYFIDDAYTQKTSSQLQSLVSLIKTNPLKINDFQKQSEIYSNSIGNDVRVTFVNKEGTVLGDSLSLEKYQNHSNRIEIIDAFKIGAGKSIRLSETNGMTNIYYAEKIDSNTVIRLSVPLKDSLNFILMTLPVILFSLLIAGALALFLSGKLSRRIIKPLLEFSEKIDITSGNENLESLSI